MTVTVSPAARHRALPAVVAVLALLLTGCGPTKKLDISVRSAAVDILYGDQVKPAAPPRAPDANPAPEGFPGIFLPPVRRLLPEPPPPPTPGPPPPPAANCPKASPLAVPSTPATTEVQGMPKPGRYVFNRTGVVQFGGVRRRIDNHAFVRTISPGRPDPASTATRRIFAFDQVEQENGGTTTTTFRVDPGSGTLGDGGLFVAGQKTVSGSTTNDFVPQPALRIQTLPAATESTIYTTNRETGVDPVNGTYETLSHLTGAVTRVDVCGTVVDTWQVTVSADVVAQTSKFHLDVVYDVATQLGGLIVREKSVVDGTTSDLQSFHAELVTSLRSLTPIASP